MMQILCDTNILIRIAKPDDSAHQTVIDATLLLHEQGHELVIVPQCLYEFYAVATRPVENNGLGITPEDACNSIEGHTSLFRLLRDERSIFGEWFKIVNTIQVRGKKSHDARIAAAVIRHNVNQLLTINPGDFKRYKEFLTVTPSEVVAA